MKYVRALALASILALAGCGSGDESGGEGGEKPEGSEIAAVPAEGLFPLEAGLWERTLRPTSGATSVERVCLDDSLRSRVIPLTEVRGVVSECKLLEQSEASMFGVTFRLQCTQPKATEVGGNMRFKDGVLTTDLNLAEGGAGEGALPVGAKIETKRIGECPAGMKPGDVADPSGKVAGSIRG